MIVRCYHCGNVWDYKGKHSKRVSCGVCSGKVYIQKSEIMFKNGGDELFEKIYEDYITKGYEVQALGK